MSYSFKVIKKDGKLELGEVSEGMLEHIPDGTFTISGHHVTGQPGWSNAETIGVGLTDSDDKYVASAQAGADLGRKPSDESRASGDASSKGTDQS